MPANADLWDLFSKAKPSKNHLAEVTGYELPGRNQDYLAKGASGEPIFLVAVSTQTSGAVPVRLRHFTSEQVYCKVKAASGRRKSGDFVRLICKTDDVAVHRLFVLGGEAILRLLPALPTAPQIQRSIESFVELFSALTKPSARSVKGLWAELFLIDRSPKSTQMLTAWHVDKGQRFDFSAEKVHLEVKASEASQRIHEFSIEQLRPTSGADAYIASILMQRDSGGPSILDLVERICSKVKTPELIEKLWVNVSGTLGRDFAESADAKFDEGFAAATLRAVRAADIPCIALPLPTDVLGARLRVSLDVVAERKSVPFHRVQKLFTS